MADNDDPAAAAARLEAALDRIARLSVRRPASAEKAGNDTRPEVSAEVAARLDALILQLRKLLPRSDE